MRIKNTYYGIVDAKNVAINENEIAQRMSTERGYTNDVIERCEKVLRENVRCRYSAVRTDILCEGNSIDFGFMKTESSDLAKNLQGCEEAFVMTMTLGIDVDRLLTKLSATSASEHYITDALSSALAEAVCDYAENRLKGDTLCRPRFSPGYGDLPLDIQKDVLNVVSAEKLLGITLSETNLMIPQKSITAIIGIIKN
ncbi:MAG: hypothetical protein IKL40_06540 [Clostridia bacterium]|nr:hypothetical protein [Clostridia bacterium]